MLLKMDRIILTAFFATSLMTVFSYLYSAIRKKQYREPELLNILLSRLNFGKILTITHPSAGWIIHYLIGFLFILAYFLLWNVLGIVPTFLTCCILGAVSGMIGIMGWKIVLNLHPYPPAIIYREFYFQLLIAHVVFGVGAFLSIILLSG